MKPEQTSSTSSKCSTTRPSVTATSAACRLFNLKPTIFLGSRVSSEPWEVHIQDLLIPAENDAVAAIAVLSHDHALAVGTHVIEHTAKTIQRIALESIGQKFPLRFELPDRRVECSLGNKHDTFRIYGKSSSGIGV